MLWTSFDYIDESVKEAVNLMPGLLPVSYRTFSLPVEYCEVKFRVSRGKKADIIEQFVLESLGSNFRVTPKFLSEVFGLDHVFTDECIKKLKKLKVIKEDDDLIRLTKTGAVFAKCGYLPEGSEEKIIDFYYEKKFGMHYIADDGTAGSYDKYDKIKVPEKTKFINRELLLLVAKEKDIEIENVAEGKIINEFVSFNCATAGKTDYVEIWLYDFVNERLLCRVYDRAKGIFRDDISDYIERYICPGDITVKGVYEILIGNDYAKPQNELFRKIKKRYTDARFEDISVGKDMIIADCFNIEAIFGEYTKDLSGMLYIVSPWLYGEVVDETVLNCIKSADFTVIGRNKNIILNHETEDMLYDIKDSRGVPKVFICNTSAGNKVFCTENFYMEGSVDYSQQQDFYLPGETVCACRGNPYFKKIEAAFLELVEHEIITDDSRKIISCLNFCLSCNKPELVCKLADVAVKAYSKNHEILHNIFVFLKINGLFMLTEENLRILEKIGLADENGEILHDRWSFTWK